MVCNLLDDVLVHPIHSYFIVLSSTIHVRYELDNYVDCLRRGKSHLDVAE